MLTHLHISNFAIIDQIAIDVKPGQSALTGETGAGKSILLDALGLVLGDRAESNTVQQGKDKADITAIFEIDQVPEAKAWLNEQALNCEGECILRRVIAAEGRSKAFINGQPTTLQALRELGEMLVSIHGQHEHQSLLKRDVQRQRLDDFAGHTDLLDQTRQHYAAWQNIQEQLLKLQAADSNRSERLDILSYQVKELEQLNLQADEYPTLNEQHKRLLHAHDLLTAAQEALNLLYEADEHTVYTQIHAQQHKLNELTRHDEALLPIVETLNAAMINIEETADALRSYADSIEIDPGQLSGMEERISTIHELSRKHHISPDELYELSEQLKSELESLEHADERLQDLQTEAQNRLTAYQQSAKQLSRSREKAAKQLSNSVSQAMQTLGMQGGRFVVDIQAMHKTLPAQDGMDLIEFLVSANPGQSPKPLSKVASGGELSRISLAIQMITAGNEPIPTLIFDEVDAGIGGGIAEIVGRHLRALGEQRQVLCVTHLPQVAAQAHHHYKISKSDQPPIQTNIICLNTQQRVHEVARMLGGIEITANTLKHAEEMLAI